jgi:cyclopropane fatty-acyl-phospholipid synthase-like methyltransferase
MIEPEHPTEKYMRGRISFHQSQAEWFQQHDQITLAKWARDIAETWRRKLDAKVNRPVLVQGASGDA